MNRWKDARATLLTGLGLTLALSVTQGWNWPLLADARAGTVALGVLGFGACITSRWGATAVSTTPIAFIANVTGIALVGAGVIGILADSLPDLVVMMGATFVLWSLATVRHLAGGAPHRWRAATA
jgi:hypothetical protein